MNGFRLPLVELTQYGFEWGPLIITRSCSSGTQGWTITDIRTPWYPKGLQLYVTRTGKIRLLGVGGEYIFRKNPKRSRKKSKKVHHAHNT